MEISLDKLGLPLEIRDRVASWLTPDFDPSTHKEIENLVASGDTKSLIDRFFRDLEFGTGGLRGIMEAGTNRMNKYTVMMATQGLANYILSHSNGRAAAVAIAHDSRNNSLHFTEETALVLAGNGIKVHLFNDIRPTPVLSYSVRKLGTIAGIVITASHNPKEYNGYKVYWNDGAQIIAPQDEAIIEEVKKIKSIKDVRTITKSEALKKKLIQTHDKDINKPYLKLVKSLSLHPDIIKKAGLKIVYTPLHGAGYRLVPESLKNYGFKNVTIVKEQAVTDGNFPTVRSPNPEENDALNLSINLAKSVKADLVLATDPDCDRLGIAVRDDRTGEYQLFSGNQLGSILVYYILTVLKEKNVVKKDPFVIKTVVTTDLVQNICDYFNISLVNVLTGFKYIAAIIRERKGSDFVFGFEESYGFLAGDFVRDKDGVIASCLTAEAAAWARSRGMSMIGLMDEIYGKFGYYDEKQKSLYFEGKEGLDKMRKIMVSLESTPLKEIGGRKLLKLLNFRTLKAMEHFPGNREIPFPYQVPASDVLALVYEGDLKITIRPSGTEPKIKFYISLRSMDKSKNLDSLKKNTKETLSGLSDTFTQKVKSLAG